MVTLEVCMEISFLDRQGYSQRAIARKLGIHRKTVRKHLEGGGSPEYRKQARRQTILDSYREIIQDWLSQDNYRGSWIHDRLVRMGYGGSYDTVKNYVRQIKEGMSRLAYLRFETAAGEQAQVDWADFQVTEPSGTSSTVYLFAFVLGYSRAMYAELVPRCTLEAFLDAHIRAFGYLGGVPAEILYDNMKHVVTDRKDGRVEFNIEFLHFAHHYRFKASPCPPYSPWVKGKVERPIDYVRERFWRGYRFESVEQSNRDLLVWMTETANQRVHGTYGVPVRVRWEQEKEKLGARPPMDYDTSVKVFRKVYRDCRVSYNCNRYVVPHHVVGKRILLKVKGSTIRFYHDDELLVTYPEAQGKGQVVANPVFYEQLKQDREQNRRKYGSVKGKATRGLVTSSLFPQVQYRPLADYEQMFEGGGAWNN
jgi:transposase